MSDIDLQSTYSKLTDAFGDGSSQDIHKEDDLFSELKIFRFTVFSHVDNALSTLKYSRTFVSGTSINGKPG